MNKLFYPAIFHEENTGIWVSFPDFPECLTEGDDLPHAYEMAIDALGLAITSRMQENEPIPSPSDPHGIQLDENSFSVIISFDLEAYKKRTNQRAIKKTLTIPGWLDEEALSLGINFSQVLQEALLAKINSHIQ